MRRVAVLAALSACGVSLALPSTASAQAPGQSAGPAPHATAIAPAEVGPAPRTGWIIGGALGPGSISAVDDSSEALDGFSVNVHFGGLISPRFAVVADLWGVIHEGDQYGAELTLTHSIFTVAAQYWVTPRFYLKGGVGRASYTVIQDSTTYESDDVPAMMGAVGYEVSHSRSFSLDLQARLGAAEYEGGKLRNGALVLGLNWF